MRRLILFTHACLPAGVYEEDLHVLLSIYLSHFGEISTVKDVRKLTCSWTDALPRVRFYQLVRSIRCLVQTVIHSWYVNKANKF